jgi:hypothetical protein
MVMVNDEIVDGDQMHLHPTWCEGLTEALVQCRLHQPMEGVQGLTQSQWTPPLGEYLHRIALVANRVAGKTMMMEKYLLFAGHSDGHGNVLIPYRVHHPIEGVQGYSGSN